MASMSVEDQAFVAVPQLRSAFGREVTGIDFDAGDLEKISKASYMRWATVRFAEAPFEQRVVLKVARDETVHGLAREGIFYSRWAELAALSSQPEQAHSLLAGFLPGVLIAEADMAAGSKRILMEDMSTCVQSGMFFGSGNPNNWGKDLEKEKKGLELSAAEATALALSVAAKLHANFWECASLLPGSSGSEVDHLAWLGGSGWHAGQGQEQWERRQQDTREKWQELKVKIADGSTGVTWDPLLVECLDAAVAKISWEVFQADLKTQSFTLVHKDFHPANFMVRPAAQAGEGHKMVLLDWEMVGVGSGPQDVAQFMISHTDPGLRLEIERGAVEAYFAELKALNPTITMTFDECWKEYVAGGAGKWLWLMPLLGAMCPPAMNQFFQDQLAAFLRDHGVTPQSVPMPRP